MGRGLEERLGLERYKGILNACEENVKAMAIVIYSHHTANEEKHSCQACIKAIYDKRQKLDVSIFDGLIVKILENKISNSAYIKKPYIKNG